MFRFLSLAAIAGLVSSCKPPLRGKTALDRADSLLSRDAMAACRLYESVILQRYISEGEFGRAARGLARCASLTGRLGRLFHIREDVDRVRGRDAAAYFQGFIELAGGPSGRETAKVLFSSIRSKILSADALYRLGMMSLQDDNPAGARSLLHKAVNLGAGPGARVAFAQALALTGQFLEARKTLASVLVQGPSPVERKRAERLSGIMDNLEARMSLAVRKTARRAQKFLDRGLPSHAVELLEASQEKGLHHPRLLALLGLAHLQLGNDARAVAALMQAAKGPPPSWSALAVLGRLFLERGELDKARGYLERAVALHPFDGQSQRSLALVLDRMQFHRRAAKQWEKVVFLSSRSAESLTHWGLALGKAGKRKKAVAVLEEAVAVAPGNGDAWVALGDQLLQQYRAAQGSAGSEALIRRAKKAYRKALAAKPGDPVLLMKLKRLGVDVVGLLR